MNGDYLDSEAARKKEERKKPNKPTTKKQLQSFPREIALSGGKG